VTNVRVLFHCNTSFLFDKLVLLIRNISCVVKQRTRNNLSNVYPSHILSLPLPHSSKSHQMLCVSVCCNIPFCHTHTHSLLSSRAPIPIKAQRWHNKPYVLCTVAKGEGTRSQNDRCEVFYPYLTLYGTNTRHFLDITFSPFLVTKFVNAFSTSVSSKQQT